MADNITQLHPFYQNFSSAHDVDSLFETMEGVAHVVAAQPLDRIYEVMKSFCQPIAEQFVAIQLKRTSNTEDDQRKVAGTTHSCDYL